MCPRRQKGLVWLLTSCGMRVWLAQPSTRQAQTHLNSDEASHKLGGSQAAFWGTGCVRQLQA